MPENEFDSLETVDEPATEARLGEMVTYRDHQGHQKVALVIGTTASITAEAGVPVPDANSVHLSVFSPSGSRYAKHNIPEGDGPSTFTRHG